SRYTPYLHSFPTRRSSDLTEIVVQFKKAPDVLFRNTPAKESLEANKLVFHIQPDQGIEFRFHAKTPGPFTALQKVEMRFDYRERSEEHTSELQSRENLVCR